MAEEVIHEYQAILKAARCLPPAEQWRLAKELVSGEHFVALWEDWQKRLAAQGDVASEAEIDVTVAQVRAERHRGNGDTALALRVVLDTNVAVSGLLSHQGAAHTILDLAVHHRERLRLGASEENRDELLATLRAPRLASRIVATGSTPEALYMLYTILTDPPIPTTLW